MGFDGQGLGLKGLGLKGWGSRHLGSSARVHMPSPPLQAKGPVFEGVQLAGLGLEG